MKHVEVFVAAVLVLSLTGCVVGGKPKTVAAAPAPPKPEVAPPSPPPRPNLSSPQTQVDLPAPQPLSAEAWATTVPPEETATPVSPRPGPRGPKRGSGTTNAATQRNTEPVGPPATTATAPAAPPTTEPEQRPQIGEIVPAAELRRLQADAEKARHDLLEKLQSIGRRRLSDKDKDLKEQAISYEKRSLAAQHQGDMRMAFELASRGLVLAKALVDGR
ncbi:MAG TPA: hypothetical protein VKU19_06905 [Bryobacteraceae bacterium]|nr:hypothetical protein [Bryobacteraceae bacterium]